jgi:hypothetical protein
MANVQGNLRSGIQLIQSELQEIATNSVAGTSDINSMTPTLINYRAMRGIGETCAPTTTTALTVRADSSYKGRTPTATRDGALVYLDTDSTTTADDTWLPVAITGVAASTCSDGSAAWRVSVALTPAQVARIYDPSPIRTYEVMEIGKVTDNGQDWLGIRSVSSGTEAVLVPAIGPLTSSGLSLSYFNSAGAVTATASAVKTILITLRGLSDQPVNTGFGGIVGNPTDSLQIRVQLRNSN